LSHRARKIECPSFLARLLVSLWELIFMIFILERNVYVIFTKNVSIRLSLWKVFFLSSFHFISQFKQSYRESKRASFSFQRQSTMCRCSIWKTILCQIPNLHTVHVDMPFFSTLSYYIVCEVHISYRHKGINMMCRTKSFFQPKTGERKRLEVVSYLAPAKCYVLQWISKLTTWDSLVLFFRVNVIWLGKWYWVEMESSQEKGSFYWEMRRRFYMAFDMV